MTETTAQGIAARDDRCPRCGDGFLCGVNDDAPCPCTAVTLDAVTRAALRARYDGCLCLRCLRCFQVLRDTALISPN